MDPILSFKRVSFRIRLDARGQWRRINNEKLIEILKLLPMTNCKDCGLPTCMVFAARMADGVKGVEDCPGLGIDNQQRLEEYMRQFKFDV
jgi:ArsR family metal-binding transcriptional regulator